MHITFFDRHSVLFDQPVLLVSGWMATATWQPSKKCAKSFEPNVRNCFAQEQSSCRIIQDRIANARCYRCWSLGTGRCCLTRRTHWILVLASFFFSEDQGAHASIPVHNWGRSQWGEQGEHGDHDQVRCSRQHRWSGIQAEEVSRGCVCWIMTL